jgi:hypothetical protein
MEPVYTLRDLCIFCSQSLGEEILPKDMKLPLGCFPVKSPDTICHTIPYNVLFCKSCGVVQTKYIGNIDLVYSNNFAGLFGTTRNKMNILFAEFVAEGSFQGILEIGAGNGEVCDLILEKKPIVNYTIVDPSYWGSKTNRVIVPKYFEEIPMDDYRNSDAIVMSHVFEHFYKPMDVLEKISTSPNIQKIYLNWPNLEEFVRGGTYNVLNMEHIYYAENQFLEQIFARFGFSMKRKELYNSFAVFYEFTRDSFINTTPFPLNKTTFQDTKDFFLKLFKFVEQCNEILDANPELPMYIWPCSVHTSFCVMAGLHEDRITNILDNSPEKIGNYQYGFKVQCVSFRSIIESPQPKLILLVGGIYAKEVIEACKKNPTNQILIL